MKWLNLLYILIVKLFLIRSINSFYVSSFDTIYINDETIKGKDYHSLLIQNELYINMSLGTPKQNIKAILTMDKNGFMIFEKAFNYNQSKTYEEIKDNLKIGLFKSFNSFLLKDHFYFSNFNSYNYFQKYIIESNNQELIELAHNITKTNKTFFSIMLIKNKSNNSNKKYYKYGIIGLQLNKNSYNKLPDFISSLKQSKDINSYSFSLKFKNEINKDFTYNENKGYFIIGEELTNDKIEMDKICYTNAIKYGGGINWEIKFDNIYSKSEKNGTSNRIFKSKRNQGIFYVNKPYILGTKEYQEFIKEIFFEELIENNICFINDKINNKNYFSYFCDSTSSIFMNKLNNKFPDLIFEHKELGENFTLTKKDLFAYNTFNRSDLNLYFLVMFANPKGHLFIFSWTLGIPFLKKYRLSFNIDTNKIGYYKDDGKIIVHKGIYNNSNSLYNYGFSFYKLAIIIILIFVIFILGMFFQRKIIKLSRKKKTYELDDDYEYNSNNKNSDINTYNNSNTKEVELGCKLIN